MGKLSLLVAFSVIVLIVVVNVMASNFQDTSDPEPDLPSIQGLDAEAADEPIRPRRYYHHPPPQQQNPGKSFENRLESPFAMGLSLLFFVFSCCCPSLSGGSGPGPRGGYGAYRGYGRGGNQVEKYLFLEPYFWKLYNYCDYQKCMQAYEFYQRISKGNES